jgi:polyhydroxybutyrate depolymerase
MNPPGRGARKWLRRILIGVPLLVVVLPLAIAVGAAIVVGLFDRGSATLVSTGEEREYLLHVPPGHDSRRAAPLVVSLHAGATWPAQQANLSGWNRIADEEGFLVVYPAGRPELPILGIPRIWAVEREASRVRDVRLVADLLDRIAADHAIDPARVYVDGMSQGGGMAFAVSCELADRIAAVGLVASAQARPFEACAGAPPMPVIAFHGTADPLVPFAGGRLGDPFNPVKPVYPPIREFVARWAERNGCAAEPVESRPAAGVLRLEYPDCAGGASVVFHEVEGAGHVWPGGKRLPEWRVGPNSSAVDATRTSWEFFRAHPRPPPPPPRPAASAR